MFTARTIVNSECLKCGTVEKGMIQVGPIVMCLNCYSNEFQGSNNPLISNRPQYLKWLRIYKKRNSL